MIVQTIISLEWTFFWLRWVLGHLEHRHRNPSSCSSTCVCSELWHIFMPAWEFPCWLLCRSVLLDCTWKAQQLRVFQLRTSTWCLSVREKFLLLGQIGLHAPFGGRWRNLQGGWTDPGSSHIWRGLMGKQTRWLPRPLYKEEPAERAERRGPAQASVCLHAHAVEADWISAAALFAHVVSKSQAIHCSIRSTHLVLLEERHQNRLKTKLDVCSGKKTFIQVNSQSQEL